MLVSLTGDNIYGLDSSNSAKSMDAAFAPAVYSNIPWVAVLVDGFGNYNLEVGGVEDTDFENTSLLNLYFLDSGDYSKVSFISGFDWIKSSQQLWFQITSANFQKAYMNEPMPQKEAALGLAYFHIPLPEYDNFDSSNFTCVKQDIIGAASVNSGFFTTLVEAGDVKVVFAGHDRINDFCGKLTNLNLCLAGGFQYHASGKTGWQGEQEWWELAWRKWRMVNGDLTTPLKHGNALMIKILPELMLRSYGERMFKTTKSCHF
ncbi:hypothetical protein TSUD_316940 [Trifolium subterraneum]|uniref:Calcineurin-like phosphoesterase domain-containing protein n=1 Tax=Trifolium subterraneum TaxID=3900 RepID=A0A2Z6NR97_TRISU|nr:hypothetical protein TSUD_316940 [Trifolium subterraneum]